MRHLILSFFFLISVKATLACGGWDPFGEDIRFSILDPHLFDDGGMSEFYYSTNYLSEMYVHAPSSDRNIDDWLAIVGGGVSRDSIFTAVYRLSALEIVDPKNTNPFVQKMFALGKKADLEYLAFAKKYSYLNNQYLDPWERDRSDLNKNRAKAIGLSIREARSAKNSELKRRYAFLAIRLAFYQNDNDIVNDLYQTYFTDADQLTIDLWAKYYQLHSVKSSAERNYKLAQLFEKIPSKRHGLFVLYDREIKAEDVMAFAQTDKQKANVLVMYTYREKGRKLANITEIFKLDPTNPLLPFLLVREVNKLEDWVLSPTYTSFAPVMREGVYAYSTGDSLVKKGVEEDIAYATAFLNWMEMIQPTLNKELHASLTTLLQFICEKPTDALRTLNNANFEGEDLKAWRLHLLEVLKVAANENSRLESVDMSVFLVDDFSDRERYIFLIGRMFEFRGKLPEAALLYGAMNNSDKGWDWFVWAEPKGITTYNSSYYSDYFDYFDANYTAQDVKDILLYATTLSLKQGDLKSLSANILKNKTKLLDLIGTKYLRQDELQKAVKALAKVPKNYWTSKDEPYHYYLKANPFYANFYSAHKKTDGDTISYTKSEVAEELYRLIELEKTQTGNAQAKTNFSIANCYFNMTTYGNSWMMRRSWWSIRAYNTVYVDSDEFNKCLKAKEYYLKASEAATKDEFKAVCLRMAGRCESHKLYFEEKHDYSIDYKKFGGFREYMFNKNKYYNQLEDEYPQWRDELVTNCYSFNRFYHSI